MAKTEFFYDYNEDNLYIYKEKKSFGSIEFGEDIVIDFDTEGNAVALEFFNASKVLSNLTGKKITKAKLAELKKAKLDCERKGGILIMSFWLYLVKETVQEKLNLQDLKYKSPVLAVCEFKRT